MKKTLSGIVFATCLNLYAMPVGPIIRETGMIIKAAHLEHADDVIRLSGGRLSTGAKLAERSLPQGVIDDVLKVAQKDTTVAGRFFHPDAVSLLRKYPNSAEDIFPVLFKHDGTHALKTFNRVSDVFKGNTNAAGKALASLEPEQLIQVNRALDGKTVNPKLLAEAVYKISDTNAYKTPVGDLWETIAAAQANNGRVWALGLKKGSVIIDGKSTSIHGIDGIGVSASAKPIIIDYTINKNIAASGMPYQMSPEWVAVRWNKFVLIPENASKLERMGVAKKYIRAVSAEEVEIKFIRKLVVPKGGTVAGMPLAKMKGTRDLIELDGR